MVAATNSQFVSMEDDINNPNDNIYSPDPNAKNFQFVSNQAITNINVSQPQIIPGSPHEKRVTLTFVLGNDPSTLGNTDTVDFAVFWAGHLAKDRDYSGPNNGAADAPGASFHMSVNGYLDVNGNNSKDAGEADLGGGDRSLNNGVLVSTSLAWEKRDIAGTNSLIGGAVFQVALNPFDLASPSLVVVDDIDGVTLDIDVDRDPNPGSFRLEDIQFSTYTVTELTAPAGYLNNSTPKLVTVSSTAPTGVVGTMEVADGLDFYDTAIQPSIKIDKDADLATVNAAGQVINYTIKVTNTGNVSLTTVVLTDAFASATYSGGDTDTDNQLDVTEVWVYTASHLVTQAEMDAGLDLVNVAVVDTDQTDEQKDDAVTLVKQDPSLSIAKDVSSITVGTADGKVDNAGDKFNYSIVVKNTGNVTLTTVTMTDVFADATSLVRGSDIVGDNDNLLEVGEAWAWTAIHTVTQAEMDAGKDLVNVAVVDTDQTDEQKDDAVSVPLDYKAEFAVGKSTTTETVYAVGVYIPYTVTIANTGNDTLGGIKLLDSFSNTAPPPVNLLDNVTGDVDNDNIQDPDEVWLLGDTDNDLMLDVGEKWTVQYSNQVTQEVWNFEIADDNDKRIR